jgi:GNAT superfamily N-acetyltransferase
MLIRPIEERDFPAVAQLFRHLSERFIVHDIAPESAAMFLKENDEDALRRFHAAGTHVFHVADDGGAIAGYIAIRARTHLFHMFVTEAQQGKGLSRQLWDAARAASGHDGDFTVNSSNFALPIYRAFGFTPTAPLQCVRGITFTPMALFVSAP